LKRYFRPIVEELSILYFTSKHWQKDMQGFSKSFSSSPPRPQKRVKEHVAGWARPTGNMLLVNLGWGACCQAERRLRSPERICFSSGHDAIVDATIIGESISYNHDDAHDTFMTLSPYTSAREDEVRQLGRIYN
jgi:hypothetical protein